MNATVSNPSSQFAWKSLLVPSNFVETVKSDMNTFKNYKLDLSNDKVKFAALRTLCLGGMAISAFTIGAIAWGLFWSSAAIVLKVGLTAAAFVACRVLFESKFNKNSDSIGLIDPIVMSDAQLPVVEIDIK